MTRFPDIAGIVLAGGEGRRMGGAAKALCEVGGVAIIDRILPILRPLFAEIVIVANAPAPYRGRAAITSPGALVVACDMPFLAPGPIARVCEAARAGAFDLAVPCSPRGFEPLHAFYARGVAPLLEQAIRRGRHKIRRAVAECRIAYVPFSAAELGAFCNVNSRWDLDACNGGADAREAAGTLAGHRGS